MNVRPLHYLSLLIILFAMLAGCSGISAVPRADGDLGHPFAPPPPPPPTDEPTSGPTASPTASPTTSPTTGPTSTPTPKATATPPTNTTHTICATITSYNGSGVSQDVVGNQDCAFGWSNGPPILTCLGSPVCTGEVEGVPYTEPYYISMNIVSGFPVGLTATVVNCPSGDESTTSPCVPAINETMASPFAVTATFGPTGNAGPTTTLNLQQIGTSALSGATCNSATWANGSFILVADAYGNKVYLPISQTEDGSGCTNGTSARLK